MTREYAADGHAHGSMTSPSPSQDAAATSEVGCRGRRVADFYLVGHPKCGTTALYEMLRQHPQIFLPDRKEPMFLAGDLIRPRPGPTRRPTTLDEYLEVFEPATPSQVVGDASTLYLSSRTAARSIADLKPSAKIIAIFREPASFLRSFHLQMLRSHNELVRDLRQALLLEPDRKSGRNVPRRAWGPQLLQYSQMIRYTDQLSRYHELFGRDQVLVLAYDTFKNDNAGTLRQVFRFLGVDEAFEVPAVNANPTFALRSQALDDMVRRVAFGRGSASVVVKAAIKATVPETPRRRLLDLVRQLLRSDPPPVDDALMRELRHRFKPEVQRFSKYVGLDFVRLWGYEDL